MTAVPRVSIVVPTYNSADYVGITIESVRAQTFEQWELVIFDDGSTDTTVAVASALAARDDRVRVIAGANGGVASARNNGFGATDPASEFVVFLDNDDVWEPDLLATLLDVLDAHPEYVSAHSIARCIDGDGNQPPHDDLEDHLRDRKRFGPTGVESTAPDQPTTFADLVHSNWIVTPGLHLIRRRELEAVGGFDGDTVPCDDWDMNVRVSRRGDIGYVDRPLLHWRRHADAQSYSAGWVKGFYRARRKILLDPTNSPEQQRIARMGYSTINARTFTTVKDLLAERRFTEAARRLKRAVVGTGHYVRAAVERRSIDRRAPLCPPDSPRSGRSRRTERGSSN